MKGCSLSHDYASCLYLFNYVQPASNMYINTIPFTASDSHELLAVSFCKA